jgi:hypothetical protein
VELLRRGVREPEQRRGYGAGNGEHHEGDGSRSDGAAVKHLPHLPSGRDHDERDREVHRDRMEAAKDEEGVCEIHDPQKVSRSVRVKQTGRTRKVERITEEIAGNRWFRGL